MTTKTHTTATRHSPRARCVRRRCSAAAVALALTAAAVSEAPQAVADPSASLRAAVDASRGTSCSPLRSDLRADQAADEVNQSNDKWLKHEARAQPVIDVLPVLKDLGYGGSKAAMLLGAGTTAADAIKAVLLQGYAKIPDCSYTDYGVSAMYNESKGVILTTVVLAS